MGKTRGVHRNGGNSTAARKAGTSVACRDRRRARHVPHGERRVRRSPHETGRRRLVPAAHRREPPVGRRGRHRRLRRFGGGGHACQNGLARDGARGRRAGSLHGHPPRAALPFDREARARGGRRGRRTCPLGVGDRPARAVGAGPRPAGLEAVAARAVHGVAARHRRRRRVVACPRRRGRRRGRLRRRGGVAPPARPHVRPGRRRRAGGCGRGCAFLRHGGQR